MCPTACVSCLLLLSDLSNDFGVMMEMMAKAMYVLIKQRYHSIL